MTPSVTRPIGLAIEHTKRILFRPFDLGKWFTLGFCAFLATLGDGGGGGGGCSGWGGGPGRAAPGPGAPGGGVPPEIQEGIDWVRNNVTSVILIGVVVLALVLGLTALFTWLQSRGKFMLLAGVARNQARVTAPWREFRDLGNSLFGFAFVLQLIGMTVVMLCAAAGFAIAWPDIKAGHFGDNAMFGLLFGGLPLVVVGFALIVVTLLLDDFVVPTMYLRRVPVMSAWSIARAELFAGNVGTLVLFYLMKIVLGLVIGVLGILMICGTCCIGALPYLSSVVLLPLSVFGASYTLCFIEQFGPQWGFFTPADGAPHCYVCGYNLTGNTTGICPECGASLIPPAPPAGPV